MSVLVDDIPTRSVDDLRREHIERVRPIAALFGGEVPPFEIRDGDESQWMSRQRRCRVIIDDAGKIWKLRQVAGLLGHSTGFISAMFDAAEARHEQWLPISGRKFKRMECSKSWAMRMTWRQKNHWPVVMPDMADDE